MLRRISAVLPLLLALPPAAVTQGVDTPLRVEMAEFVFRPSTIRLTAGRPVKLLFVNRGQIAHQFQADYFRSLPVSIVDATMHLESPGITIVRLEPGARATIEFLPRAKGRFPFACTIEGHREAGMQGVLEVP
jgi:uncharacterized cupredoxin-like copper-binding protein